MKNPLRIVLENTEPPVTLLVGDEQVSMQPYDEEVAKRFTTSQQRIVIELARHLNTFVPYKHLFAAYQDDGYWDDSSNKRLHRMRDNLPAPIKEALVTKKGLGYMLVGTVVDDDPVDTALQTHSTAKPCDERLETLTGEYYGFFLEPTGLGNALGAYIRIEEAEEASGLTVDAVLGVRSDDILFSEELSQIFSEEKARRYDRYQAFHKACSPNNRRCFWGEGVIRSVGTVAEIALTTAKGPTWSVAIELGNFLKGARSRHSGDEGKYRGGLGIATAIATQYGTFACKFGLIRKEFCKPSLSLGNGELCDLLKLSAGDGRIPLTVDLREDNYWYSWFMSE